MIEIIPIDLLFGMSIIFLKFPFFLLSWISFSLSTCMYFKGPRTLALARGEVTQRIKQV